MSTQRAFMKKSDMVLLGALAGLALLGVLFYSLWQGGRSQGSGANIAVLSLDGSTVATYDLGAYTDHQIIDLEPLTGIHAQLEFEDGRVRFIQVDCPDKICESVGYISREMQSAVCLPNRMALAIYTPEEYANSLRR